VEKALKSGSGLLCLLLIGCGEAPKPRTAAEQTAPAVSTVSTVAATMENWPATYEATGTVRARTTAVISAKLTGYVREVRAEAGARVKEGQLLVTLDTRDLDIATRRAEAAREEVRTAMPEADSAVAAARANLDLAEVTLGRMKDLLQKKSISSQEFDEATARWKAAQSGFDMAKARRTQLNSKLAQAEQEVRSTEVMRSYAEVTAPFAGMVVARSVEPGSLAMPGAPLLTIEREGAYRLEAPVEEGRPVKAGQGVSVFLGDDCVEARVSEIVPAVDAASRAYTVKIDLPARAGLRSGMFGRAVFAKGARAVLAIPAGAVTERGQVQTVQVVEGGATRARLVTLGQKSGDRVEVLSGLSAGEKVAVQ
jgi:membrane fusion protein, multidrug efflux system